MGGEIGCQSKPGTGSAFWFEIPLLLAEMADPSREETRSVLARQVARKKLHILVVDDVKANRDVAGALLVSMGHEVGFAGSGIEALEKLSVNQFDTVLMDLQMPQMDGFAAARAIRAIPAPLGQIPIFALTASVMPEQITAAHEAGMNGHIGKPLSRESLSTTLARLETARTEIVSGQNSTGAPQDDQIILDRPVLDLLKSELKGAAAGVIREFMVEMQVIRDQFVSELAQEHPRADAIAQDIHRLLGAARTLGAVTLCAQLGAFQKSYPRDSAVFSAEHGAELRLVIAETDRTLQELEIYFQANLIGEEA
jgi:CheY-like chemotaxis protein/HPt (histidine-containing phosphotransfer) domain-containing protein